MDLLVLDLDGTITKSDNIIRFSTFMIFKKKQIKFLLFFALFFLLKFKIIDNKKFKILYSSLIIKNIDTEYLKECVTHYITSESFKNDLNCDVLNFIDKHHNAEKVILSANFSFLVKNISTYLNIQNQISINLDTQSNLYTGKIIGQIPFGLEKIDAIKSYISGKNYNMTIGLGDSKSDIPLLKYLDEGYLIGINEKTQVTKFEKV